ncbi:hypothetical protein OSTOST_03817, partial [Ostertagia ostertagi]
MLEEGSVPRRGSDFRVWKTNIGLFPEAIDSGVSYLAKTDAHEVVALRLSTFRTREEAAGEAQLEVQPTQPTQVSTVDRHEDRELTLLAPNPSETAAQETSAKKKLHENDKKL